MLRLIGVAFAALCLIGTGSLTMADYATKGEIGNMKDGMKAEKGAMQGDMKAKKEEMKGKMKVRKDAMKVKHHEMKEKMKAHKDAAKAEGEEANGVPQAMGQDMKATVPAAPAAAP